MESSVKVSVCVPVYGVEPYIEKCVRSLMTQTMKEGIEFIFVNDCTKDKSIEILKKVVSEYPERSNQVKIVNHETNKGLSAARLTGMQHAIGEYVAHCDSDDWVATEMYKSLYTAAKNIDADIVSCNFIMETDKESKYISFDYENNRELYLKDVISNIWGTVWKFIIKRQIFLDGKIQIDKNICHGEDYVYTSQCLLAAKKYINIDGYYYHYNCQNMTSMMRNPSLNSAQQQYSASELVFKILEQNGLLAQYSDAILLRKIFTRNRFLPFGIAKWRQIYPEIGLKYLTLSRISLYKKVGYILLQYLPSKITDKIILKRLK